MAVPIGTLIPPKLAAQGMEYVVTWAKGIGLTALDLPDDFAECTRLCREHGLLIGTIAGA